MKLTCAYCKKSFDRTKIKPSVINHFCCRNHFILWRKEQTTTNKCLSCGKETTNPKFCSRSCSASYTNKQFPKRKLEGKCIDCGKPIAKNNVYCKECHKLQTKALDYRTATLAEVKSKRTSYPHSRIRQLARDSYIKAGRPQECKICGYSNFFHVCHIKGIKDFPENTLISVINDQNNLVALCPNHHTEFDNGLITLT